MNSSSYSVQGSAQDSNKPQRFENFSPTSESFEPGGSVDGNPIPSLESIGTPRPGGGADGVVMRQSGDIQPLRTHTSESHDDDGSPEKSLQVTSGATASSRITLIPARVDKGVAH